VGKTAAERIWVIADGEMGGPGHYVTGVSAELLMDERATADCPALPDNLEPLSLDRRIWLGMSERRAARKLGPSSFRKGAYQLLVQSCAAVQRHVRRV